MGITENGKKLGGKSSQTDKTTYKQKRRRTSIFYKWPLGVTECLRDTKRTCLLPRTNWRHSTSRHAAALQYSSTLAPVQVRGTWKKTTNKLNSVLAHTLEGAGTQGVNGAGRWRGKQGGGVMESVTRQPAEVIMIGQFMYLAPTYLYDTSCMAPVIAEGGISCNPPMGVTLCLPWHQ